MRQTLQAYLGVPDEWPVIEEHQHAFHLSVHSEDVKHAVTADCKHCVLANAAARIAGQGDAFFGREIAYIPLRNSKGEGYIGKFSIPKDIRGLVTAFDLTGRWPAGASVTLTPIYPSKRAEARRIAKRLLQQDAQHVATHRKTQMQDNGRRKPPRNLVVSAARMLP